jgi:hypothetical protein
MMDAEGAVIKERITTSEVNYKRLLKLCTSLIEQDAPIDSLQQSLNAEAESFEAMLTRLQLQMNMNQEEMARYEQQKQQSLSQIDSLVQKSAQLQESLVEAQKARANKEECNAVVDDMVRPKKVVVPEGDSTVSIIGLLNCSRADDIKLNESMQEEIADLDAQLLRYQGLWDVRKSKFDKFMASIEDFKKDVLSKASIGNEEEQDEEHPYQSDVQTRQPSEAMEQPPDKPTEQTEPQDMEPPEQAEPQDIEMAD